MGAFLEGLRGSAQRTFKNLLRSRGWELFNAGRYYAQDGLFTVHSDHFRHDERFRSAYLRGVQAAAGTDPHMEWRIHIALWAASLGLRTVGDFVECGVNAGFVSSAVMQRFDWNSTGRRFFLIDTFSGPVLEQFSADEVRGGRADIAQQALANGAFVTDVEAVRRNFSEWPQARVIEGRVPDILPHVPAEAVAFLHLDMNCAQPEHDALMFFWDRLPRGGAVLFDDYTYYGNPSQTQAIDEAARELAVEVLALPTGQGLIIK